MGAIRRLLGRRLVLAATMAAGLGGSLALIAAMAIAVSATDGRVAVAWVVALVSAVLLSGAAGGAFLIRLIDSRRNALAHQSLGPRVEDIQRRVDERAADLGTLFQLLEREVTQLIRSRHEVTQTAIVSAAEAATARDKRLEAVLGEAVTWAAAAHRLEASVAAAAEKTMGVEERIDGRIDQALDQRLRSLYGEFEALLGLYAALDPAAPLPPFGGWALSSPAAQVVLDAVADPKCCAFVETGSGTSTVIAAMALARQGRGHAIALEHEPVYAAATRHLLERHGVAEWATVVDAPLTDQEIGGETYAWYSIPDGLLPDHIDVLLIDGPPQTVGPMARFPTLAMLESHLGAGTRVLLDDADRPHEVAAFERWKERFAIEDVVRFDTKRGMVSFRLGT